LNSGVLVFDLHKWKNARLIPFWKEWGSKPHARSYLGDQDVLNVYFQQHREELYKLPCQWNVRTDSQCDVALGNAGILHGNRMSFEILGDERWGWHSGWNLIAQYWRYNQQPVLQQPLPILQGGVSINMATLLVIGAHFFGRDRNDMHYQKLASQSWNKTILVDAHPLVYLNLAAINFPDPLGSMQLSISSIFEGMSGVKSLVTFERYLD
jgi:hypothetical protein